MKRIQFFVFALLIVIANACDVNNEIEPIRSYIVIEGEEIDFAESGVVIDRVLNDDSSYKTNIKLSFDDSSYVLFTLNSENDRTFNKDPYIWSDISENGTINSAEVFLEGGEEKLDLTADSFLIETSNNQFSISFELIGDMEVSGVFVGQLEFQERYVKGVGSFEFDGTIYETPYFALSDIIQNADGFYLARLYFYNVDPTNPFLRDQRAHSIYVTIVQLTSEELQPGNYSTNDVLRPYSLIDGKPIIDSNYEFLSGNASFTKTDSLYNVSFVLTVADPMGEIKTASGNYSGVINDW